MRSRIYEGQVRHRRFSPRPHRFSYRMYMMFLDLEELPTLFDDRWFWSVDRANIASFRREDHLGDPDTPLIDAVREKIQDETGYAAKGPIRLLTHCRYFGFGFNPVSFYYCYDEADTRVDTIVAEVNNTPWGEQYCYVLTGNQSVSESPNRLRFMPSKDFHVSPFMPMNIDYDWRFNMPDDRLNVHMINIIDGEKLFDATLELEARELNSRTLASVLIRFPLVTMKVVAGIYFEALRLLLKRTPFFDHPDTVTTEAKTRET